MALFIEIKAADGIVSRTKLDAGRNRFTVRLGDSYRIFDDQTGLTPEGIAVKRVDNSLVVDGFEAEDTVVEFAEFYSVCSAGSPCELTVDKGAGIAPVAITPGTQPIGALADGAFVLYDPDFAETAPAAPSFSDGTALRYGLYGLGGLAVVGLAAGGGGGGDSGGDGTRPAGALKLTSSTFVNSRTPTITGEGEPGSRVIMRIDTDGDGSPNVTYGTTVGPDSKWSINTATAVPESGALPEGGLPLTSNVGITSTTATGNASLPTFVLTFDGTPPGPAVINTVATDNVVNASEKAAGVIVSGSAEAGALVTLTLGSQVLASVPANAAGGWQTALIPAASLPGDGVYTLSATVQDQAGNLSQPTPLGVRVDTAPPPLSARAGGDDRVGIAESASVAIAGQTVANASVQVQWTGPAKATTADANGDYRVVYTGAEVPNSAGETFPYSVSATSLIGNQAVVNGQVLVDRAAPLAPSINVIAGDDRVTFSERGNGVVVSGSAEASSDVTVTWGGTSLAERAGVDGRWNLTFGAGQVPSQSTPVVAAATDAVGNLGASAQRPVIIDQAFGPPTIAVVEGNNIVNSAEAADGVILSGTIPVGVTALNVFWADAAGNNTVAVPLTVSGGTWSLNVPPGNVPADGPTTVAAVIAGPGGGAFAQQPVTVDRAPPAAPVVQLVEGDDSISLIERLDGFAVTGLAGSAEAGAAISVAFGSVPTKGAVANPAGAWEVSFTASEVPTGPGPVPLFVTATDVAGNTGAATARNINVEGTSGVSPPSSVEDFGSAVAWPELLVGAADSSGDQLQSASQSQPQLQSGFSSVAGTESVSPVDAGSAANYIGASAASGMSDPLETLLATEAQSTGRFA